MRLKQIGLNNQLNMISYIYADIYVIYRQQCWLTRDYRYCLSIASYVISVPFTAFTLTSAGLCNTLAPITYSCPTEKSICISSRADKRAVCGSVCSIANNNKHYYEYSVQALYADFESLKLLQLHPAPILFVACSQQEEGKLGWAFAI